MALQIQGKFISNEAIDGEKLLLQSGQAVRLMSASGEVRLIELDESTGKVKVNGVVVALQPDLTAEINRAIAAEGVLQQNITNEASTRAAADIALQGEVDAVEADLAQEILDRAAADTSLQGSISSVSSALSQEVSDRQAGDTSTLSSANSYTDTKVAALVNSAPAVLDTLKELADALGSDPNFATTISGQIGTVSSAVSSEVTRATNAEAALQSEIDAVESDLAQELLDRAAAVSSVQAEVDAVEVSLANEITNRTAAVAAVQTEVDAVELALAAEITNRINDVNAEETRAIAAEAALQAQITELTGGSGGLSLSSLDARIDVIEGSGEGSVVKAEQDAKDYADAAVLVEKTRAEAAEAVLTSSIAQEVLDRQAAVTQLSTSTQALIQAEANARVDADDAFQSDITDLDARLDTLEGSGEGSVAKAEADAKAYADQKIAQLVDSAPALLDTLNELAAALGDDPNFATSITSTISTGDATTLSSANTYTDGKVAVVQGEVDAVEIALAAEITNRINDVNAEEARAISAEGLLSGRLNIIEGAVTVEGSVAKAEQDAKDYADAAVLVEKLRAESAEDNLADDILAEETRAINAENALDARLDILEGADTVEGSVAKAEKDAKDYTDAEVGAEEVRAMGAESALDGRLDVLEARAFYKLKFVLSAQDIANGYVNLGHQALANSVVASVGRLMIHEGVGEDFTMSVVSGVSRMTFVGNLVSPSEEQLAAGDVIFVRYMA